jgi:8-oxo-dGTP pyrophosphatase MutT (NUDIX family)
MYIKIYFGNKPLFLCDEFNEEINFFAHHDDAVFIDEFSSAAVNAMLHEMRQDKIHAGIFYNSKLEALKKSIWKKFTIVQAGGGFVLNEQEQVLFIFRRGKWDLPKGKLDKGEKIEDCAQREVKEETGLNGVKIEKFLMNTYHTYDESGKHILKETSWYLMRGNSAQALTPQTSEDITELKWMGKESLQVVLKNTYAAILDVIKAGMQDQGSSIDLKNSDC